MMGSLRFTDTAVFTHTTCMELLFQYTLSSRPQKTIIFKIPLSSQSLFSCMMGPLDPEEWADWPRLPVPLFQRQPTGKLQTVHPGPGGMPTGSRMTTGWAPAHVAAMVLPPYQGSYSLTGGGPDPKAATLSLNPRNETGTTRARVVPSGSVLTRRRAVLRGWGEMPGPGSVPGPRSVLWLGAAPRW